METVTQDSVGDVVNVFVRNVEVAGQPYTIEAHIYLKRLSGPVVYHAPAPFKSCRDGEIVNLGEHAEYVLQCYDEDGGLLDEWDSGECDNGVEDQRSDRVGAKEFALTTIEEFASNPKSFYELFNVFDEDQPVSLYKNSRQL